MSTVAKRAAALAAARIERAPAQRWTHGQDEYRPPHPRMPTSVNSGVACLRKAGLIGDAEVTAAERWLRDYVCGVLGGRDPEADRAGPAPAADLHARELARSAAVTRCGEIAEVLGPAMERWLIAFLARDLSFSAMADAFLPGRAAGRIEMTGRMTVLLMCLAGLYASIDRRRR